MGFLALDGTFWMQLINFAIFFVILNAVFLKPVGSAIAKRRAYINGLTTDYDSYTQQLRELTAQAESKRAAARRDADSTLASARAAISNDAATVAAQYASETQAIAEEAHQTVATEIQAARRAVAPIVRGLAELMLQRVIPHEVA
ncbi:MAG: hypothetical protein M3160_01805 [Candidatus Eremiobacteraeota bacterium]|nr:hypothetical protein [Candidatus Eremiobacteraeota bacterium]